MKPRSTFEKRRKEELRKARQQDKAERRAARKVTRDDGTTEDLPLEENDADAAPASSESLPTNTSKIDEPDRVLSNAGGVATQ